MDAVEALRLYGTSEAAPVRRTLACGPLACHWSEGALQAVCWHGVEVLRGVSYLLRDRDWGTVPARVEGLEVLEDEDGFDLRHCLVMATPEGTLTATAHLCGTADGRLTFEVTATPSADISTNRCGFVILFSASLAGSSLEVEHTDGQSSRTTFPREISPSQPVFDIRALTYAPAQGLRVACRLEAQLPGDPRGRYEMEDQRNWSDASFKTYVASLLDPWPYVLPAGKALAQRVSLAIEGLPAEVGGSQARSIAFGGTGIARMPAIGVGVPAGLALAHIGEVAALRDLGAAWWIVEAALDDADLAADLAAVATHRTGTSVAVQLDVIVPAACTPRAAAERVASLCKSAGLVLEAIRMLPAAYLRSYQPSDVWPDLPPLEAYARAARACFPAAEIGGGMYTSYTELNRRRPTADGLDFIGHLTTPLVHAADDASVMQTMEALPHIAHSVRTLWPGLRYRLGPSTLALRRNPYGKAVASNRGCRQRLAVADADPRHGSEFGAAWTVAYAAAVAPLQLEVLALHESHGPRGPLPSTDGAPRPIPAWSRLATLAAASNAPIVTIDFLPPQVAGLAWLTERGNVSGLLANTGIDPQTMHFSAPVAFDGELPATSLTLQAYQTVRLDRNPAATD